VFACGLGGTITPENGRQQLAMMGVMAVEEQVVQQETGLLAGKAGQGLVVIPSLACAKELYF
jgi:hypothetical protein